MNLFLVKILLLQHQRGNNQRLFRFATFIKVNSVVEVVDMELTQYYGRDPHERASNLHHSMS